MSSDAYGTQASMSQTGTAEYSKSGDVSDQLDIVRKSLEETAKKGEVKVRYHVIRGKITDG